MHEEMGDGGGGVFSLQQDKEGEKRNKPTKDTLAGPTSLEKIGEKNL